MFAGNYENKYDTFFENIFYPNEGVCLVNIILFRKDELYKKAFYISKSYTKLSCPFQDILISISIYKFKYFPLKYIVKSFLIMMNKWKKINNTKTIKLWINNQRNSPYKYSIKEILEASI